jgi:hypothetical protein
VHVANIIRSIGSILRKIDLTKFATSTKIEALTKELVEMRKTSPGSKAIVFSQVSVSNRCKYCIFFVLNCIQ